MNRDTVVRRAYNHLRGADRRGCLRFSTGYNNAEPECDPNRPPAYEARSAFEEYRYDALGRRVLVRTRQDFVCNERCLRQTRRMVWDGDQLLYEVAAPGATSATAAQMERDTGLITPFGTGGYFFQTGRVEYVHGHGIDAPLAFYREEYSDSIPGASFIPQANWRGVYDMGVRSGACYFRNWTTQPATPPDERKIGGVDTTSNTGGTSGTETLCADVEWPAQYTWAYHQYRRGYNGPYNWMGSLAYGSRDASGLHYRRNRFYDAESGRFTQEDPIGMAGGINVYGFANGDPVSYSDPYGLSASCDPPRPNCPETMAGQAHAAARRWFAQAKDQAVELAGDIGRGLGEVTGVSDFIRAGFGWDPNGGEDVAAGGRLQAAGTLLLSVAVPEAAVLSNLNRTRRAAQGADVTVSRLGRFYRATWEVAGNGGGQSRTVWNKVINSEGRTVRMYHDTYDRAGHFQHRKFKVPDDHRAP